MFARFNQPEGLPILVKTSRVVAFARTEDGQTRIFLGGVLSVLVAEDEDAVLKTLSDAASPYGEPPY